MTPADAYADLLRRAKEVALLNSCSAVLQWDQQTFMPRKAAGLRGEQVAALAGLVHAKATAPRVGELLDILEGSDLTRDPESWEAADVREARRQCDRATKVPARLVEELARVTTQAQEAWVEAKTADSFPTFRPWLEQVLALKREEADAVGHSGQRYDALLDEYEPGAIAAGIRALFADLSAELVPLVQAIGASGRRPDRAVLERDYPVDRQKLFAESAASAIGFDFAAGRLDVAAHPFCSGFGPGDCRLTTRYQPRSFPDGFFGALHEAGHGLYEQNLPEDRFGAPAGGFCSLGVHESQSRLWENQVGRSKPFWDHFLPRLKQTFPAAADIDPEAWYFAVNDVRPSLIRVEADEATYNLHIALRFELEVDLLSGDLPVADLPGAWNERFERLFGLAVPSDRQGCLQDIHWSFGGVGYFPTYTLGNLFAAQLMSAARRELGGAELDADFRRGEFGRLRDWLVRHVHRPGRRYSAAELVRRATGAAPTAGPFVRYLREKFGPLYGVC